MTEEAEAGGWMYAGGLFCLEGRDAFEGGGELIGRLGLGRSRDEIDGWMDGRENG